MKLRVAKKVLRRNTTHAGARLRIRQAYKGGKRPMTLSQFRTGRRGRWDYWPAKKDNQD